jgi:hypothetical protein
MSASIDRKYEVLADANAILTAVHLRSTHDAFRSRTAWVIACITRKARSRAFEGCGYG